MAALVDLRDARDMADPLALAEHVAPCPTEADLEALGALARQANFAGAITERLAERAMRLSAGDVEGVAQGLEKIGGRLMHRTHDGEGNEHATRVGPSGLTVGIWPCEPVSCAIMLGGAVFGRLWPFVVPGVIEDVKRRWKAHRKAPLKAASGVKDFDTDLSSGWGDRLTHPKRWR